MAEDQKIKAEGKLSDLRFEFRKRMDELLSVHKVVYGDDPVKPMLQQSMEELSELAAAISRVLRGRRDLNHGIILEEFADVKICMFMIEHLADMDLEAPVPNWTPRTFLYSDTVRRKITRAADRLLAIAQGHRPRPAYGHT